MNEPSDGKVGEGPAASAAPARPQPVPILNYHAVGDHVSRRIRTYSFPTSVFARQLDHLCEQGYRALTVSQFADAAYRGLGDVPSRPVVITFDDGFLNFYDEALPLLEQRGLVATLYVITGFVERSSMRRAGWAEDGMMSYPQLEEVVQRGVEVGGHSHTHAELDLLPLPAARDEISSCKALLEDRLRLPIRSFAYPYGYSTPAVRRAVAQAGYTSACGVKHAMSCTADDPLWLARLSLTRGLSHEQFARWVRGEGIRHAPCSDRRRTQAWRQVRRLRAVARRPFARQAR
jgi:peptidoglycan/xylan/chitin deacetylase (PgdA/CDA1 family)